MIIFLVLIVLLIILLGAIGYFNTTSTFKRAAPLSSSDNPPPPNFTLSPDYYSLKNTWAEMKIGTAQDGESCYNDQMCNGSSQCYKNPITNQQVCFPSTDAAKKQGYIIKNSQDSIPDYSIPKLYTTICAQETQDGDSYKPYYPNVTTILSSPSGRTKCEDILYQGIISTQNTNTCYDSDQIYGTKVVEMCMAQESTNNVCINTNGDRVYYPDFNTVRIKQDLTVCEDNTSINYVALNYNNSPQTLNNFNTVNPDKYSFAGNQVYCLSVESIDYYPSIQIDQVQTDYYLSFEGSWGFVYKIKIDPKSPPTSISSSSNLEFSPDFDDYDSTTLKDNLDLDFTSYGITYKFPTISNITSNTFDLSISSKKLGTFSTGTMQNISSLDSSLSPDANVELQPCAAFDTSYGETNAKKKDAKFRSTLADGTDRQRFKISRFALGSDGTLTPDQNGMISSIVYRNLNYSNGGMYLDYYVSSDGTTEKLTLREMGDDSYDESKKWLLLKPVDTSPYTIPTSSDAWCNYSYDISTDGGSNFNGKTGVRTPMTSVAITSGQDIIDPQYADIISQPNNTLFNDIATGILIAGQIYSTADEPDPIGQLRDIGLEIKNLKKSSVTLFHWQNGDPSFAGCAQLCNRPMTTIPKVKAVALNNGNLGSNPPGYNLSVTTNYAKGDILFGLNLHTVNTCKYYKKYDSGSNAPLKPISSKNIGDIYSDGEVTFIIKDTFEDTYYFETEYFNLSTNLVPAAPEPSVNAGKSNYGQTTVQQNVISKIYQKNPQVFSRTVFTSSPTPLDRCVCDETSKDNMTGPKYDITSVNGNIITTSTDISSIKTSDKICFIDINGNESVTQYDITKVTVTTITFKPSIKDETGSNGAKFIKVKSGLGCDISLNTDDKCAPFLVNVVTELNKERTDPNDPNGKKIYGYVLKDIKSTADIEASFADYYATTHSNMQAIVLIAAQINFNAEVDNTTGAVTLDKEIYESLGNLTNTITSSDLIFNDGDGSQKNLYDLKGNPLSVDLEYSNFSVNYRLYYTYSNKKSKLIALIDPKITNDGNIDFGNVGEFDIYNIDYEAYFSAINDSKTGAPAFTIEEHHTMPYVINDYSILLDYTVPIVNPKKIILKQDDKSWSIDNRAPRNLISTYPLDNKINSIQFPSEEYPIALFKDTIMQHGPSPQQMAYLGSFESADDECKKHSDDDCETDTKCKLREYDSGNICVGKTLLDKFKEEGVTLDVSQNFDGSLFNTKIEGTNNTSMVFLKTLQIAELNYHKYVDNNKNNMKGGGTMVSYIAPKTFDYYQEQGFNNLGDLLSIPKPVLGRFIPYTYFYPNYRDSDGDETCLLTQQTYSVGSGPGKQVYPYTFYENFNYTQFIPYGKKSDYQYGFEQASDIPTF